MEQRQLQGRKAANKDTDAGRLIDLVDGGYASSLLITSAESVIQEMKSSALNNEWRGVGIGGFIRESDTM